MNMRRIILTLVVCLCVATPALADLSLQIGYSGSSYGPYQKGSGGEFTVKPSGWDPLANYAVGKSVKNVGVTGTFQTFCLEAGETISGYSATYAVVLGDSAVYGGVGTADPISVGTAWLYKEFAAGTLAYDYSSARTDAAALQNAIWWLEGESGGSTNKYTAAAITKFGSEANAKANNAGQFAVKVMSLWDVGYVGVQGHQHQDLLVAVPVPGAVLLGFLGLGYAGMRLRKTV